MYNEHFWWNEFRGRKCHLSWEDSRDFIAYLRLKADGAFKIERMSQIWNRDWNPSSSTAKTGCSVFISLHLLLGDWFSKKKNLLCLLFSYSTFNPTGAWWETLLSIDYLYPIHDRKTTFLNRLRNHKYLNPSYLPCIEIIKSWELTYMFGDLIVVFCSSNLHPTASHWNGLEERVALILQ